ncbi:efflux ABC transporter, permease protein [Gemelliphila asaccharolytica]|uniref:Efflux ABC transporter, permease protein n=1 Tax=Gemelliphila asaccharolytica TaxID=502393 RepID=A0ABR5TLK8_9BACL|nr:efflux ABC transporter, permease protein [Gemella asaccharolytica]
MNIVKTTTHLEKTIYKNSNSSLILTKNKNENNSTNYFKSKKFEKLKNIDGIGEFVYQYEGVAKLLNYNVVDGEQKVEREELSDNMKNILSVIATTNTKRNIFFSSGMFNIEEGRNIDKNDKNKIVIHKDLAMKNNLKLNDRVKLKMTSIEKGGLNTKEIEYEIVGIFSGKKQESYTGLSSDLTENSVFTDYLSSQQSLNLQEEEMLVDKLFLYFNDPQKTKQMLQQVKKEIDVDWQKYQIEENSDIFKKVLESISGIKSIIKTMTYSIMLGGCIVLCLLLILWLRERIYEIGIFLSLGINKAKIITQFILELILVSIPALVLSALIGNIVVKQTISSIITLDDFQKISSNIVNLGYNTENLITFLESYLILIIIILISVIFTTGTILIKKPKEILSKLS